MMTDISILDLIQLGLGTGVLIWLVIAFQRRKLYSDEVVSELMALKDARIEDLKHQVSIMTEDRNEWKDMALRNVGLAAEAVKVVGL